MRSIAERRHRQAARCIGCSLHAQPCGAEAPPGCLRSPCPVACLCGHEPERRAERRLCVDTRAGSVSASGVCGVAWPEIVGP
eukprot:356631-Chlamydomonas_euryale.AAC.3